MSQDQEAPPEKYIAHCRDGKNTIGKSPSDRKLFRCITQHIYQNSVYAIELKENIKAPSRERIQWEEDEVLGVEGNYISKMSRIEFGLGSNHAIRRSQQSIFICMERESNTFFDGGVFAEWEINLANWRCVFFLPKCSNMDTTKIMLEPLFLFDFGQDQG